MRITILTIGSRGDLQPYVPLGIGLKAAGHEVRIASHAAFADIVQPFGLEFFPLAVDPMKALETPEGREWVNSGRNQVQFIRFFRRVMRPRLQEALGDAWLACQGSEAIIFSRLGIIAYHIAEKLGVPSFLAALQPITRTRHMPCDGVEGIPGWLPFQGEINWLSFMIVEQVFWQPFRDLVNDWRKNELHLPPVPFMGPYGPMIKNHHPALYGFSPTIIPRPPDWGDWLHTTGYWFLDPAPNWQPPPELVNFIEAGPPPISIGFGSMRDRDNDQLLEMVTQALKRTGQRAVMLTGWSGINHTPPSDNLFMAHDIPHAWLFPRMAAVVHHGGAGTTAAGFRAGVPNVIIPYFADQSFWAKHVVRLGVGPHALPRHHLTADKLANVIQS